MANPFVDLRDAIDALAIEREVDVNVMEAAPAQLSAPSLIILTDDPWMTYADADQPFGTFSEHYRIIAVVALGDPRSASPALRQLVRLARDGADSIKGWSWRGTGGITPVEDVGIDYLSATVRVTYAADDYEQLAGG